MGSAVENLGHRAVDLLATSVPDLKSQVLILDADAIRLEFGPDSDIVFLIKISANESVEKARLANAYIG